jgi:hypothetical protein
MIRRQHLSVAAIAIVALSACSQTPDQVASGVAADAARSASSATPPAVVADAARPNRVVDPMTWTDPQQRAAYAAAKKHAAVLEQVYCYCHCKENIGHRALIQCFETDHGSNCDVCMTEALIAAKMTEEGRTPAEIQKAIDAYYGG